MNTEINKLIMSMGITAVMELRKKVGNYSNFCDLLQLAGNINTQGIQNCIAMLHDDYVSTIIRMPELDQFSTTHVQYFNMRGTGNSEEKLKYFRFINEKYDWVEAIELTKEEVLAICTQWDNEATKIVAPDNGGKYLVICDESKEMYTLFNRVIMQSHYDNSFPSLKRCFLYLGSNKFERNKRLRIHFINKCYGKFGFVLETINRQGEWKKVFNGGIIKHKDSVWSTHT